MRILLLSVLLITAIAPVNAQTFPSNDPVIQAMWATGVEKSMTRQLAHELVDVVGPRLAGSPQLEKAQTWITGKYASWGIPARTEQVVLAFLSLSSPAVQGI